jgi:hypothetical protein
VPVLHDSCASEVLIAFLVAFVDSYEQLRNLAPGEGPTLTVPKCSTSPDAEVRRALALADAAAREWAPSALGGEPGGEPARQYLRQVSKIADADAAREAEGLLQAAFQRATGFSRVAIGEAREATTAAAEIETGVDNGPATFGAAHAAGACLASASYASSPSGVGTRTAQDKVEQLA